MLHELEPLSGKRREGIKSALLPGVIRRQATHHRLVFLRLCNTGSVNFEKGLVSSQQIPPGIRFRYLHCCKQILEFLKNLVRVAYP